MNTVIYIDIARNKKRLLHILLYTVIFFFSAFIVSLLADTIVPSLNTHFNFPNAICNYLLFYEWSKHLYVNIWYLTIFIFPMIIIFLLMEGFACSIVEEEEFETLPYMRNLGIERKTILISKLVLRLVWFLAICLLSFLENLIFFLLLNEKKMILISGVFFGKMFLSGLFCLSVAFFVAACSLREKSCSKTCLLILLIQFLLARIYSYVGLMADCLFASGKTYNELEWLYGLSGKLAFLRILSPVQWCYPGQQVPIAVVICAVVIAAVLCVGGYSIYNKDQVVFRNQ